MSETGRIAIWVATSAVLGAVIGAALGGMLSLPGAGPIGVGVLLGAAIGYLFGLRKPE